MKKIWLVIQREYLTRVRKKSFIIMTILGPILMALVYGALIFIAVSEEEKEHVVMVVDSSPSHFSDGLRDYNQHRPNSKLQLIWKYDDYFQARDSIFNEAYSSILYIPRDPVAHPRGMYLSFKDRPSMSVKSALEIELEKLIEEQKLIQYNLDPNIFDSVRVKINLFEKRIKESAGGLEEEADFSDQKFFLAFGSSMLIYIFILLYGIQVLRGVMEEKTSRIVEVMVSSVKPFQLMMGKIIGIAMVGLTQFLIWVIFSGIVVTVISAVFAPSLMEQISSGSLETQAEIGGLDVSSLLNVFNMTDFTVMISLFIFYFLGGYLLYSSLFAAVGSAIDYESDSQQFMMPVTLPLIFSIAIAQFVLKNPEGTIAKICSFIPLTSPIVMMVRIPFGVPIWEVLLSALFLIGGFIFTTWIAARIYRTGMLMYGKKITYRELWKWLFYKG
ncbi:MAG: ABC transporter permease [Flavobacteriales bacterium]|nr:ABC transporter permease [Flavobacteriales bacterium]